MKTLKKIVFGFFTFMALIIALAYAFNYQHLFNAIRLTYLKGQTSATIDDGVDFPSHNIAKGAAQPWQKDTLYNKTSLPKNIVENLNSTHSASFLVIKNGKLMHVEYFDGYNASSKTNSFSMAKAITVILMGCAIQDKKIKSENQKFADFYPNFKNVQYGSDLTLRELADMEAGYYWDEDYKNPFLQNPRIYYGKNMGEALLAFPQFEAKPGTHFEYQSGATQLLGFAVRKAVGIPLAHYASQKLWKPLGMESESYWNTDENGMEKTFCCVNAIPRDYAKLGQLLLQKGNWNGKQLLDSTYIQKMVTPTKLSGGIYGMGIWVNNDAPVKFYHFWGFTSQLIIVIPEKNMVIVRTGKYNGEAKDQKGRSVQAAFLAEHVAKLFAD
jgi:CubicO group peptidase (beta-lactamase class C family)